MADKIKFVLALALVAAGVFGFYQLSQEASIWRFLSVVAGLAAGAAVAAFSDAGRRFFSFARESVAETKKVVWPGRKETIQTTAFVFVFTVVMAIFLWMTDKGLELVLYDLLLGWKK